MYFDSHTHLNDDKLYSQREQHLKNFFDKGGRSLINVGINHERNLKTLEITKKRNTTHEKKENIFASIGIHPTETIFGDIKSSIDIKKGIYQLEELYNKNTEYIVAIGECGNDAHHGNYQHVQGLQKELFYAQCILAHKLQLPIIIHSRDNFNDIFQILQNFKNLKIYFHCRGYTVKEINLLIKTFPKLRIGFCGNISYPKAYSLRESFQKIINTPGSQFLIETDAPYLPPQTKRGKINTPLYIIDTYTYISTIFNISLQDLQIQVKKYFEKFINKNTLL